MFPSIRLEFPYYMTYQDLLTSVFIHKKIMTFYIMSLAQWLLTHEDAKSHQNYIMLDERMHATL